MTNNQKVAINPVEAAMTAATAKRFEANQKDLWIDDVKILWAGENIILFKETPDRAAAVITADERAVTKVQSWCVKNQCRCSAIREGRIGL